MFWKKEIKEYSPEDLDQILKLYEYGSRKNELVPTYNSTKFNSLFSEPEKHLFMVKSYSKILGLINCWIDEEYQKAQSSRIDYLFSQNNNKKNYLMLLEYSESKLREKGFKNLYYWISEKAMRKQYHVLRQHGYQSILYSMDLVKKLERYIPFPEWPDGFDIEIFSPKEDRISLITLINVIFGSEEGHVDYSKKQLDLELQEPTYLPGGTFFLKYEEERIGCARIFQNIPYQGAARVGYISCLGIIPEYRKMGLGKKLLQYCLAFLWKKQFQFVELIAYNPIAQRMYLNEEFIQQGQFIKLLKQI